MKNVKPKQKRKNNRNGMGGGVKTLKAKGCQPGHPIFSRGANDSSFLFTLLPYLKKIKYLVLNISFPFQLHPSLTYIYTRSFSRAILLLFSFSNHFPISPSLSLSLLSTLTLSHTQRKPSLRLRRLGCSSSIFDFLSLRRRFSLSKVSLLRSEVLFLFSLLLSC